MENQKVTTSPRENVITLRDIVELFLNNWHWFAISAILCVAIAWIYLSAVSPVYQRTAVMLVKSDNQSTPNDLSAMFELSGIPGGSSVENEVYILRSYQILNDVVRRLHLDIDYMVRNGLRHDHLFGELPFDIRFLDIYEGDTELKVSVVSEKECRVSDIEVDGENKDYNELVAFNDTLSTPAGRIIISQKPEYINQYIEKDILITRSDLETATNTVMKRIQTSAMDQKSTLVNIVYQDVNIARADAILSTILQVYNETIVEDKNRIASNTASFIDDRIVIISHELGEVENQLTTFKQEHRIVDLSANANLYLQEGSKAKEESIQLEAQLNVVEFIRNYMTDKTKSADLIPNVSGVGDAGVQTQIENYNEMMLQRNRLVGNSGENNPVVQNMNNNLAAMRSTIAGSIDNYMRTIRLRLQNARKVENKVNQSIESIPQQEKYALDVMRQQSIKETLYTYLLQKREETAMQLAVTEANIRVIEAPFGSRLPIAPKRMMILAAALAIGIVLPFLYLRLREFWNTGVRGRKDVEDMTTLPVLGEIPARKEGQGDEQIVVSENKNDRITEAFRLLRTNLDFMNKGAKVLMFTSTMAGEGKTFVSRNLAVILASTGKKVVLVDTDIRKRTQSKLSGANSKKGVSTFLSGKYDDIFELIIPAQLHENVDVFPAGSVPPNPAELLMSERLELLMERLKKYYDYIILDNVPALVVADASIVNRVAEITMYVIREGVLDRRYLTELERLHQEKKFNNICVVLNDVKDKSNRYGYGYGYGYGNGYYTEDGKQRRRYVSSRKSLVKKFLGKKN